MWGFFLVMFVLLLVIFGTLYLSVVVINSGSRQVPTKVVMQADNTPILPAYFEGNSHAKAIYGLLLQEGKVPEGRLILDIISHLLSVANLCNMTALKDNTVWMLGYGADKDDPEAIQHTKAYVKINEGTTTADFLVMTTHLLNKHVSRLKDVLDINTWRILQGHVYTLCTQVYPIVWSNCT